MDDLVELGRTAGAYGFRGWVRIVPLESGEVLQKARTWVLTDLKGVRTTLNIEAFRRHGDGFIAKWAGCETKEAADAARGRVSVSRADFPDAGKDAVWAVDLVGCKVVNKEGTASARSRASAPTARRICSSSPTTMLTARRPCSCFRS